MAIARAKNLLAVNYIGQTGPVLLKLPRLTSVREFTIESHGRGWRDDVHATALAFSQDENSIAIGYSNGDVAGWTLDRHAPLFVTKIAKAEVTALEFLPKGNRVVVGDELGELSILPFASS